MAIAGSSTSVIWYWILAETPLIITDGVGQSRRISAEISMMHPIMRLSDLARICSALCEETGEPELCIVNWKRFEDDE